MLTWGSTGWFGHREGQKLVPIQIGFSSEFEHTVGANPNRGFAQTDTAAFCSGMCSRDGAVQPVVNSGAARRTMLSFYTAFVHHTAIPFKVSKKTIPSFVATK